MIPLGEPPAFFLFRKFLLPVEQEVLLRRSLLKLDKARSIPSAIRKARRTWQMGPHSEEAFLPNELYDFEEVRVYFCA